MCVNIGRHCYYLHIIIYMENNITYRYFELARWLDIKSMYKNQYISIHNFRSIIKCLKIEYNSQWPQKY